MGEDITSKCSEIPEEALALIEPSYFRQDEFGSYIYDKDTNEVVLIIHKNPCRFEASVLIEMLADFIIDISQIQSLGYTQSSGETANEKI